MTALRKIWTCLLLLMAAAVSLTVPAGAAPSSLPFQDVSVSSWYYPYVRDLYEGKMVNGVDEVHFNPDGTVSLGEALKMILLAAGYPSQKPLDGHWASGYLAFARERGLMPAGTFRTLDSSINRLQIAQLAVKALGLARTGDGEPYSDTRDPSALAAYDHGIFTGVEEGNRLLFKPVDTITRAEMSAVTWRVAQTRSEGAESAGTGRKDPPQRKPGTYIQVNGTEVYVSDKIPRNPFDPALFQVDDRGYLTYESRDYTCAVGVDVSKYQGEIDWEQVRDSGVEFAILRLGYRGYGSEGRLAMDSSFVRNLQAAQEAGLEVGAYFFSQAITPEEGREEAEFCLQALRSCRITYPVVYDWEPYPSGVGARTDGLEDETLTACAEAFLQRIRQAGYQPMLYGNPTWFYFHFDMDRLAEYPLWLANYTERTTFYYQFDLWQYSCTGTVPGIQGEVDLNIRMIRK